MAERPAPAGGLPPVTIVAHHVGRVGGMERQLAELALGLRELGHEVTVIAHVCRLPPGSGVRFRRVRGPSRPFLLGYPWFIGAASLMLLRRRRGVLHATGAIVLNRADVVAVHYCHQVGVVTASRSNRLYATHVRLVGAVSRIGERLLFARNRGARFVGVSEGVAEEIREHYPELAGAVEVIHNGVDTDFFAPARHAEAAAALRARHGIAPDRLVAAFVGSEWQRKGLDVALRALAQSPEWDLAVAGAGDRAHYEALAESLGIQARVHWLGVLEDVHLAYAIADAFVLPSSYETFSLVTFEAAASGLPLLAAPVNGVRELLRDGANGFLIGQDPALIAERLRTLGQDPALRRRMGEAAREDSLGYSWKAMVRKHHELYMRVAARAG